MTEPTTPESTPETTPGPEPMSGPTPELVTGPGPTSEPVTGSEAMSEPDPTPEPAPAPIDPPAWPTAWGPPQPAPGTASGSGAAAPTAGHVPSVAGHVPRATGYVASVAGDVPPPAAPAPTAAPLAPEPAVTVPEPGPPAPDPVTAIVGAPTGSLEAVDSFGRPVPPAREPRVRLGAGAVAALTAVALVAGAVGGVAADRLLGRGPAPANPVVLPTAAPGADIEPTGVAAIAAAVLPSVVAIEVTTAVAASSGSGFVLAEDGYILTNAHVILDAVDGGTVRVLFADGVELAAELVGHTVEYDLAVLKVERTGLVPLVLGDSGAVVVGDPVVAVGAPLGLDGTVTAGIVSALNRPVSAGPQERTAWINAIQTDAAINPGNSGGPLVNAAGEVIGINSAIAQIPGLLATPGSIGLGFAIPSDQARRTAEQLIAHGHATYPIIGVLLDTTWPGEGVAVLAEGDDDAVPVTPDGPADRAGIRPGDVIVAIDGRPVTRPDELIVAIRAKAPGDAVVLTVREDGVDRDVRVVLAEHGG